MDISLFDYKLPQKLIANKPIYPRDHCKLMVINRAENKIVHKHFYDIVDFLKKDDVLVLNETKVFPARFFAKKDTGGKIEVLLLEEFETGKWKVLTTPGIKVGQSIYFHDLEFKCVGHAEQMAILSTNKGRTEVLQVMDKFGVTPLPPYITSREREKTTRKNYQTVYAKYQGSVAAPTAGLHFTKNLLSKIKKMGVQIEYVTLHVGLGTFAPVKENDITKHKIHSEEYSVKKDTYNRIISAKKKGKRIIAVGTTSVRVLESVDNKHLSGSTNIFIYPGYKFKLVDGMITNFHLPKSTLIALIAAFCGIELMREIYKSAVKNRYRFFSFGDASLII